MSREIRVTSIDIFPIKSCRGITVTRAEVTRRGLALDRRWMIVEREGGRFVSQREEARLALVDVAVREGALALSAPGMGALALPVAHDEGARRDVTVWRTTVPAAVHREGSEWMSAYLSRALDLVYLPDDVHREINPKYAAPGDHVSFADGYPLLLASEGSLADLNARLAAPLPMRRFRPNVTISGAAAWDEETWPSVRIGALSFRAPKPCERCVVTTIDPATAEKGPEPLRTLAAYRNREGAVWFGMNLVPDAEGQLAIGDVVLPG